MKKVVILGCENSHANTFLKFIEEGKYPEIEVVGVHSVSHVLSKKLNKQFGVPVMSSYDEAVGKVDGVIVTARHGDNHYKYAAPYITSTPAMFIDKPITIDEAEAVKFMQELKDANVRVTGGSCCKYADFIERLKKEHKKNVGGETVGGFVRAPISMKNAYGDIFFYSQHLVEMVLSVYGNYPLSVKAFENGNKLNVVFRYKDFDITGLFIEENYYYYAARYSSSGTNASVIDLPGDSPCFRIEFEAFYKLLLGEKQQQSYKDFIAPVFVINAINRSLISGNEEKVTEYEV